MYEITLIDKFLESTWFAIMVGVLGQVLGTQKIKFWLPHDMNDWRRSRIIEAISLALGFTPTLIAYWGMNNWSGNSFQTGVWLGFVVMLSGIVIYKIVVNILYKKYPGLEESLSAETNAKLKRREVQVDDEGF